MPPKHSHEKFFRKFFQIYPRRLFADFLARICDEGNGCLLLAIGGGTLFLWACGLVAGSAPLLSSFPLSLVAPALSLVAFPFPRSFFPCGLPFPIGWQHRGGSGTIGAAGPVVFLVLLGGGGLPFRGLALLPSGASGAPQTGAKGLPFLPSSRA